MKLAFIGLIATGVVYLFAQQEPALRKGVSVQMAVAAHSTAVPAADRAEATVIAVTADGNIFDGATPTDLAALGRLTATPIYLKADARAPYQKVLSILDALHGKQVVLLTAAVAPPKGQMIPPYGLRLTLQ